MVMYQFYYDYVKLKYTEKAKLCYMDTDSFNVYITAEDIYLDIAKDVQTEVNGLLKYKLAGKKMKEFAAFRNVTKTLVYIYKHNHYFQDCIYII